MTSVENMQSPGGQTPLCRHIAEVVFHIQQMTPMLRQNGQRVVVTIASDGESSDGNVAHALRALQVRDEWK
jgi:hypothetical protein